MPRGFGKARWELTVQDSTRNGIAEKLGADENLEVTREAGRLLDNFAKYGVVFNRVQAEHYLDVRERSDLFSRAQDTAEQAISTTERAVFLAQVYEKATYNLAAKLVVERKKNERLTALLEEHCKGCPASELR